MTIKIGDRLPSVEFITTAPDGKQTVTTDGVFVGRKVVLFAVPGAFTPTCSMAHLPSYIDEYEALKAKGVDTIACTAVNDIDVLRAWSKMSGADGKVMMLADGNATFAKAIGLAKDLTVAGMGLRSSRYSMIVDNGVVTHLNIEDKPGLNVSGADTILTQL
ncbi:MAG: peroxiredoxin [Hyphomicrobiales bacterium]